MIGRRILLLPVGCRGGLRLLGFVLAHPRVRRFRKREVPKAILQIIEHHSIATVSVAVATNMEGCRGLIGSGRIVAGRIAWTFVGVHFTRRSASTGQFVTA